MKNWHNSDTKFKKGRTPWNKGMKVDRIKYPNMGHFEEHSEETKALLKKNHKHLRNEQIGTWKGDKVGYQALHDWVKVRRGRAKECAYCGNKKRVQWANKSHEYKRDIKDWVQLCQKCHGAYDSGEHWGKGVKRFNKTI